MFSSAFDTSSPSLCNANLRLSSPEHEDILRSEESSYGGGVREHSIVPSTDADSSSTCSDESWRKLHYILTWNQLNGGSSDPPPQFLSLSQKSEALATNCDTVSLQDIMKELDAFCGIHTLGEAHLSATSTRVVFSDSRSTLPNPLDSDSDYGQDFHSNNPSPLPAPNVDAEMPSPPSFAPNLKRVVRKRSSRFLKGIGSVVRKKSDARSPSHTPAWLATAERPTITSAFGSKLLVRRPNLIPPSPSSRSHTPTPRDWYLRTETPGDRTPSLQERDLITSARSRTDTGSRTASPSPPLSSRKLFDWRGPGSRSPLSRSRSGTQRDIETDRRTSRSCDHRAVSPSSSEGSSTAVASSFDSDDDVLVLAATPCRERLSCSQFTGNTRPSYRDIAPSSFTPASSPPEGLNTTLGRRRRSQSIAYPQFYRASHHSGESLSNINFMFPCGSGDFQSSYVPVDVEEEDACDTWPC